ncbi:MAG: cytochrome c [Proteobacteria bacterium]|nr:cytochrome c [Pseudomonadota bacterium]
MVHSFRRIGIARPILRALVLAAIVSPGGLHAEAVEQALIATMRSMGAAMTEIDKFTKGHEGAPPAESARKVVMLARSIPGIFPPGSELDELPSKFGTAASTWDDYERFLDAQKKLAVEASKLFAITGTGDRDAVARQMTMTRQACGACHETFRN